MGGLTHTVSGDIASFRTPSRVPIESLKFYFLPKQEGSGDPSPTNVRPITGWTGVNWRRAGKNMAHVLWSTNGGDADAQQKLSNNYGTSIDTLKYIEPDGRVVITQTKWDNPSLARSYMNGYVAPIISSLQRNGYYDISFKVTNITSNPLNASLSDMALSDPYGNGYVNPTVIGNVVIFKNYQHRCKDTYPNRKHFELRICGMNCTISELMVTPANKSDGVFEPFCGEIFRLNDKNILEPYPNTSENYGVSWTVDNNGVVEYDGTPTSWSNAIVGYVHLNGRTTLYGKIFGDQSNVSFGTMYVYDSNNTRIGTIGTGWEARTPDNDYVTVNLSEYTGASYVRVEVKRYSNDMPMKGKCYVVVTDNLEDLMKKDIIFPSLVYGGYIDLVRGKLVVEYEMLTDTWENWGTASDQGDGTTLRYKKFANPVYGNSINNHHTDYCNVTVYNYTNNNGRPHYYIVSNSYNCRVYLPNDFPTDQIIQVIGKLITPVEYDIPAQDLKAFLDHNNFWSDANDITEVTYAVVESKDMFDARKRIMSKTWNMLPLLYTEVEYISAKDSNPYIDMGIKFTGELEAEVHYYNDKNEAFLFGARKGASSTPYCNFNVESASSDRSRFDYGNQKAVATSGLPFEGYHDGEYIFKFHNRIATMEKVSTGEVVTKDYSSFVRTDYSDCNMLLFSVNTNGTPSLNTGTGELRAYSAKFWIGGQLVRDLVPCFRKSDNKPGMYDRVSKTFFTNAGSGEFSLPA